MMENTKELELIREKVPYLYNKFVEADEKGIKLMVHYKVENTPDKFVEKVLTETAEYLLDTAMKRLENTKAPVIFFLLDEKNGLRMDVAYTRKRIAFWTEWIMNVYFMRLRRKYVSEDYCIKHRMVEMKFKGRDCICHCVRF